MAIWFTPPTVGDANRIHEQTLVSNLGIRVTYVGDDFIVGTMPVDERTVQIHGILHGGASVALAETLGSYAATCCIDQEKFTCVGLDINANHMRPVAEGKVTAMARAIHMGKKTQVWRIEINDENDRLVCESRLTVAVIEKET